MKEKGFIHVTGRVNLFLVWNKNNAVRYIQNDTQNGAHGSYCDHAATVRVKHVIKILLFGFAFTFAFFFLTVGDDVGKT